MQRGLAPYQLDDFGRVAYTSFADLTTIADKAEVIADYYFGQKGRTKNPEMAARHLAALLKREPHFLAMCAIRRNVDAADLHQAVAGAALFLVRHVEGQTEDMLTGALTILDSAIAVDTGKGSGKKVLVNSAGILALYLEGLMAYEKTTQKPWSQTAAAFVERIRLERAPLIAAIVGENPALQPHFPEITLAAADEVQVASPLPKLSAPIAQALSSRAERKRGPSGEPDFLMPRLLKKTEFESSSMREADHVAQERLDAKDFAAARKIYEDHMHANGSYMSEGMYVRYVTTLFHTGNVLAARHILAPLMGRNARFHTHKDALALFRATDARHATGHATSTPTRRPADGSQHARQAGNGTENPAPDKK